MQKYLQCIIFFIVGLSLAGLTSASDLDRQRQAYLAAENAIVRGEAWQQWQADLQNYPLFPYLEIQALNRRLAGANQSDIDAMIAKYPNVAVIRKLKNGWLNWLIGRQKWAAYVTAYNQIKPHGSRYQCYQARGLLATDKRQQAFELAETLWSVGHSQNKACNPVFSDWQRAGLLTSDLAFKRFWLAIDEGNISLARYVSRYIKVPRDKQSIDLFWKIRAQPTLIMGNTFFRRNSHHREVLLTYGVKRLAKRDIVKAVRVWLRDRQRFYINDDYRQSMDKWLALRIAQRFMPEAERLIGWIDPKFIYPRVTEWRIRLSLVDQNWSKVSRLIAKLPETLHSKPRWRYWSMMAQKELSIKGGANIDTLSQLSVNRNFYGFLAAELNHSLFGLQQSRVLIDDNKITRLESHSPFQRALELRALKREYAARREWMGALKHLNNDERRRAAHLAHRWQWHSQAIMTAAQESMWNELDIRFPVPNPIHLFEQSASAFSVDPLWSLAVARQESAFYPQAKSGAGARGLMQLMPGTAKQTARNYGIAYKTTRDLYRPSVNIALGTAYLAEMKKKFKGNRIYATAAYNAGPSRVKRWIAQRGDLPLDIWIETIPFKETRQYVQNVLAFRVIFASLMDVPIKLFSDYELNLLAYNQ
ncbi:MAG: transglycosylase SLT domain-containing protein [Endozoicomonadaceae bacterium]|nr:transglycosylase SLT domain-containing protein [Endozoicomonadaceae bacterium]